MMKTRLFVILLVVILGGLIISYFVWAFLKDTEETAFISCLASISSDLSKMGDKIPFSPNKTDDWQILIETDTEVLLRSVRRYDCNAKEISEIKDPWGNKILIASKYGSSGLVFLAWTSGRDQISGNSDDLVYPIGTRTIAFK